MSTLSGAGLVGAVVTVAATTVDDAVWLVPFVGSSSYALLARVAHAVIFVLTLEFLSIGSVMVALIVASGVSQVDAEKQEILLGSIGAILCWTLAAFFFVKKWLKRRRRRQQHQDQEQRQDEETTLVTAEANNSSSVVESYESTEQNQNNSRPTTTPPKPLTCANIGTVISLTFLGALDELSYFPALVLGKIFTPLEVCLGTLLAAIFILVLVNYFLARCKPLVDCLDRIPIYAVIALFATVLTMGVIYDLWKE